MLYIPEYTEYTNLIFLPWNPPPSTAVVLPSLQQTNSLRGCLYVEEEKQAKKDETEVSV